MSQNEKKYTATRRLPALPALQRCGRRQPGRPGVTGQHGQALGQQRALHRPRQIATARQNITSGTTAHGWQQYTSSTTSHDCKWCSTRTAVSPSPSTQQYKCTVHNHQQYSRTVMNYSTMRYNNYKTAVHHCSSTSLQYISGTAIQDCRTQLEQYTTCGAVRPWFIHTASTASGEARSSAANCSSTPSLSTQDSRGGRRCSTRRAPAGSF